MPPRLDQASECLTHRMAESEVNDRSTIQRQNLVLRGGTRQLGSADEPPHGYSISIGLHLKHASGNITTETGFDAWASFCCRKVEQYTTARSEFERDLWVGSRKVADDSPDASGLGLRGLEKLPPGRHASK
jgi:hypothetical protein